MANGRQHGGALAARVLTLLIVAQAGLSAACGSSMSLTVRPGTAPPPELIPAAPLSAHAYRKILVLPPEAVEVKDVTATVVAERGAEYYTGLVEKALLAEGFEVISSEIVARAGSKDMSAAEKAMVLGKQSKAEAVLILQKLSIRGHTNYYVIDDMATVQVDAARVKIDEDDGPYHADTEACLHSVPYYEVRLEAKLLDAQSGTVLWVGSGAQSTIHVIQDDWVADVDDDCEILSQNFVYSDFMMEESTLALVVRALLDRVVKPLAQPAFAGAAQKAEAPKPKAAPPPAPAPPAVKMAIVSTKRASLRAGPGKRKKRVMRVPRKAKVEVLETMGEWHKVKVQDGTTGWMHEDAIILDE